MSENTGAIPALAVVVADNIARLRHAAGWSLSQAGARYGEHGLPSSKSWARSVEEGVGRPPDRQYRNLSLDQLILIADVYDVPALLLCLPRAGGSARVGDSEMALDEVGMIEAVLGRRDELKDRLGDATGSVLARALTESDLWTGALQRALQQALVDHTPFTNLREIAAQVGWVADLIATTADSAANEVTQRLQGLMRGPNDGEPKQPEEGRDAEEA